MCFLPSEILYDFSDCGYASSKLIQTSQKLKKYNDELSALIKNPDWEHPACSILLCDEKKFLKQSQTLAKKLPKPSLVIIIGIGGSNLGTMAACRTVFGNLYNVISRKPQILFADTVDPQSLVSILSISREHISQNGHILINVISKSGKTLETMVNFDVIYGKLKKIAQDGLSVVFTTDEDSELEKLATAEGFETLPIPKNVGGRYSVFSNVGLFPLQVAGLNTQKLLEGASFSLKRALDSDLQKNPASLSASFLQLHKKRGRNIHVNFMFSNNLRALGYWYSQLMGESIGKEKNEQGTKIVREGITPLLAIGTTDLHALAQLFFAGPDDKTYRFVSVGDFGEDFSVGSTKITQDIIAEAKGKKVCEIMDSLYKGTQEAYRKKGMPFVSISLPAFDEHTLGQYMQMQMLEIIYLGKLLSINPFDQPAVENYKLEAKRILKKI